jgi:MFS family permease
MLGNFVAAISASIVIPSFPLIVADLNGLASFAWIVTAYFLSIAVSAPLWGKLSDIYGRRSTFTASIAFFLAGAGICGAAQSMDMLIGGRVVQGIGVGGIIPIALAITSDVVAPRERGKWQGAQAVLFGIGSFAGPTIGGWLSDHASWRWGFYSGFPVAVVALPIVWLGPAIPTSGKRHKLDVGGAALLVTGLTAALLATSWAGGRFAWTSPAILILVAASIVLLIAFVRVERRAEEPILPWSLLRNRTFAATQWILFAAGAAQYVVQNYIPLVAEGALGRSATAAGAVLTPLLVALMAAAIVAGQFVSHTGRYRPVLLAMPLFAGAGFVLLSRLGTRSTNAEVVLDLALIGAGIGFGAGTAVVIAQSSVEAHTVGVASGSSTFSRMIGGLVALALFGAITTARIGHELAARGMSLAHRTPGEVLAKTTTVTAGTAANVHAAFAAAFSPVFLILLPLLAGAFVAVFFIKPLELARTIARLPQQQP